MPVPLDTVKVKLSQIFIVIMERITAVSMPACLHQTVIGHDFVTLSAVLHSFSLLKGTVVYDIIQQICDIFQ